MTERTNGIGEIVAILALCAVVLIGVIAVITHMNDAGFNAAKAAPQPARNEASAN